MRSKEWVEVYLCMYLYNPFTMYLYLYNLQVEFSFHTRTSVRLRNSDSVNHQSSCVVICDDDDGVKRIGYWIRTHLVDFQSSVAASLHGSSLFCPVSCGFLQFRLATCDRYFHWSETERDKQVRVSHHCNCSIRTCAEAEGWSEFTNCGVDFVLNLS